MLKNMSEIVYKDESYKIIGACFEVYRQKGLVSPNRFIKNV